MMTNKRPNIVARFPPKLHPETGFSPLFSECRYRIFYGGRAAGKSESIAMSLLIRGAAKKLRILCAREYMSSMEQSVWRTLVAMAERCGLQNFYKFEKSAIIGENGTLITFVGIHQNISSVKSTFGVDICWVEEAEDVSYDSWEILIPTIRRKEGSEIIVSFNPKWEEDDTYKRFVLNPPAGSTVVKINYEDNPFLNDTLYQEIEELRAKDADQFAHVYGGECKAYLSGAVYRNEIRDALDADPPRITNVAYDPNVEVQAFWDIGIGDMTAIWLAQRVGNEIHVIDYLQGHSTAVIHWLDILNDRDQRPFVIERHWLPHDARAREKGTGVSIEELIRQKGYRVNIVPRLTISDGINAVRTIFPQLWFDQRRCAHGITCLRNYKYDTKVKEGRQFKNDPTHDEFSHGADALRYLAIALKPPKRPYEADADGPGGLNKWYGHLGSGSHGWMGTI